MVVENRTITTNTRKYGLGAATVSGREVPSYHAYSDSQVSFDDLLVNPDRSSPRGRSNLLILIIIPRYDILIPPDVVSHH